MWVVSAIVGEVIDLPAQATDLLFQSVDAKEEFSSAVCGANNRLLIHRPTNPTYEFIDATSRRVGVLFICIHYLSRLHGNCLDLRLRIT